jgi:ankyrin repeat protein
VEDIDMVQFLLDNGAERDIKNNDGEKACDLADDEDINKLLQ